MSKQFVITQLNPTQYVLERKEWLCVSENLESLIKLRDILNEQDERIKELNEIINEFEEACK